MSGSGVRLPVVKVNPDQELVKAESRLNGLLAGLSEVNFFKLEFIKRIFPCANDSLIKYQLLATFTGG